MHLQSIRIHIDQEDQADYPLNLPFLRGLSQIHFQKPVTIFVGENGTGKSTLLEAIAVHVGSILIGGEYKEAEIFDELAKHLSLSWTIKTRKEFFFRANEFNQFIERIKRIKGDTKEKLREIIAKKGRKSLEITPYARTLSELEHLYGDGLEYRSHGESFLAMFQSRFQPGGLYILDEPEAPLSPLKQLTLISMIKEMVEANCQFIIATHSPILMSYPDADLFSFEDDQLQRTSYTDLEHVQLTRDFLNRPESFLRHL